MRVASNEGFAAMQISNHMKETEEAVWTGLADEETTNLAEAFQTVRLRSDGKVAIKYEELVVGKNYPVQAYGREYIVRRRLDDVIEVRELLS